MYIGVGTIVAILVIDWMPSSQKRTPQLADLSLAPTLSEETVMLTTTSWHPVTALIETASSSTEASCSARANA